MVPRIQLRLHYRPLIQSGFSDISGLSVDLSDLMLFLRRKRWGIGAFYLPRESLLKNKRVGQKWKLRGSLAQKD